MTKHMFLGDTSEHPSLDGIVTEADTQYKSLIKTIEKQDVIIINQAAKIARVRRIVTEWISEPVWNDEILIKVRDELLEALGDGK